jgi:CRP-like cAMP-binding protein
MSDSAVTEIVWINLNRPLLPALEGLVHLGSGAHYEDEIFELIDRILLFQELSQAEVSRLCAKMECFCAKRGETIARENEDGSFLCIVLTGKVAILKQDVDGRQKLLSVIGPGAAFGEMSVIDGKPRFATCVAREPTDFAVLTRDVIYDILLLEPSLGSKLLLLLLYHSLERLRETGERLLPFIDGSKK